MNGFYFVVKKKKVIANIISQTGYDFILTNSAKLVETNKRLQYRKEGPKSTILIFVKANWTVVVYNQHYSASTSFDISGKYIFNIYI